jgi:hypothetical protein
MDRYHNEDGRRCGVASINVEVMKAPGEGKFLEFDIEMSVEGEHLPLYPILLKLCMSRFQPDPSSVT